MTERQKGQQKASYKIILGALNERETAGEPTLARSADIIQLLGNGSFDDLARNVLTYAHNIARLKNPADMPSAF